MRDPLMHRAARISPDRAYRYELTRNWGWQGMGTPVTFVMLNPSTADGTVDDPTVRRCIGFANAWGYGGLVIVNLYAYRTKSPREMLALPGDVAVGPDNDATLAHAAETAAEHDAPLIAAWGTNARPERVAQVVALPGMERLHALRTTAAGHPGHPLYIPATATPTPWSPA